MLSSLRFTARYVLFNLRAAMAYRVSFVSQVVFMVLNDVFLLFFWWIFFQTYRSRVPDWQMADVFYVYAVSTGSFGMGVAICGNTFLISKLVAEGQLDYYLSLPRHPLWHLLVSRMNVSAIGDLLFACGVYWLTPQPSLLGFLVLLVMMAASAVIFVSCCVMAHCMTFIWGNSEGFAGLYTQALLAMSLYPRNVFERGVQVALFTIIPVGFMTFIPVDVVRAFDWRGALAVLAAAGVAAFLAERFFAWGLRRYESGNLLAARS